MAASTTVPTWYDVRQRHLQHTDRKSNSESQALRPVVISARCHRDDRVTTVVSGTWHIGYGDRFDEAKLKALQPGSSYTEPPGETHFAERGWMRFFRTSEKKKYVEVTTLLRLKQVMRDEFAPQVH